MSSKLSTPHRLCCPAGRILLHKVDGDIHDLGMNIVNMLLRCHKFAGHDPGVDVSPAILAEQAAKLQPHLVGLSGLLTSGYDAMRETIAQLQDRGYRCSHSPGRLNMGPHHGEGK